MTSVNEILNKSEKQKKAERRKLITEVIAIKIVVPIVIGAAAAALNRYLDGKIESAEEN